jgi:hypothetical protein
MRFDLHIVCGPHPNQTKCKPVQASIDEAYVDVSQLAAAELRKLGGGGEGGLRAALEQVGWI